MLEFHTPSLEDKKYFTYGSRFLAYEYQFSYDLIWCQTDHITLCRTDTALYVHNAAQDAFLLPVTDDLPAALRELKAYCEESGTHAVLECVPAEEAHRIEALGYPIEHTRDLDDYLYEGNKLISLGGKHLQAKRNHVHQFWRDYPDAVAAPMTEADFPECLALDKTWIQLGEDDEDTEEERIAIKRLFRYWKELGFVGTTIRIDGKLAAFTCGEVIDHRLAVWHFEKADTAYQGIYAVVNNEFAKMYLADVQYVNRQEDVGEEGLRKSKLSYHPETMVEKYRITF